MSILDVTEDQIFHTLGKGRDPNFKPIEKVRPVVPQPPKKTYTSQQAIRTPVRTTQQNPVQPVQEAVKYLPSPEVEESIKKLTAELSELNSRVSGIQTIVKWYIVPQFMFVMVILLALFMRSYIF